MTYNTILRIFQMFFSIYKLQSIDISMFLNEDISKMHRRAENRRRKMEDMSLTYVVVNAVERWWCRGVETSQTRRILYDKLPKIIASLPAKIP